MAEEVKKIITVEVGKSITSIRDFKKHLDDLRGSLLGLNEESEEYKTIAEQIATDQAKLNDVMKIGKTNTDAAAGSYVELNNQLKALRNQYKALSETERNSTSGQAILENINKLDNQLKDIDESMGVYNRNVGNYKNAFIDAFTAISQQVGKVNPDLGALFSSVQRLVPQFVQLGKTAKATGSMMKAAMSSTGIGLLVVALGEIITHWESIARVVSRALGLQNQYTSAVKLTKDQMSELANAASQVDINLKNSLDRARGLSDVEAATNRLGEAVDASDELVKKQERLRNETQSYIRSLDQAFNGHNTGTIINGARRLADELIYIEEEYSNKQGQLSEIERKRLNDIQSIRRDLIISNEYNIDQTQKALEDLKIYLDEEDKVYTERRRIARNQINEREKALTEARDLEKANLEGRLKQTEEYGKTESQILQEKYEADKQYIINNYRENAELRDKLLVQLEQEFKYKLAALRKGNNTDDGLQDILDRLKDYGKTEIELLDEQYRREKTILINHHEDTTKLDQEYWEKKQALINAHIESIEADIEEAAKEIQDKWREAYQKDLDAQELFEAQAISAVSNRLVNGKSTAGDSYDDIMNERQKQDEIFMIQKSGYEARIQAHQDYLLLLNQGDQEYLDIQRQIAEEEIALADLVYNHQVELDRREIQLHEEKKRAIITLASNTASVYSSFTDIMLAEEEQGSSKWKAFKTSEAVVNMLSGVLAAFMSGFNSPLPAPWNIALATSTAAVAAAAGAAQIAQINATKMGSTSSASNAITGGSGASSVGVSPLLNPDYDLQRITNLSLQSDAFLPGKTQVYVLESDIQEVGNRVQVRENNATF